MSETVVVSDLHGQADKFKAVVDHYGDDAHYILNGDLFDRSSGIKDLLNIVKGLNHDLLLGNHEWILLGALSDNDPERRKAWQESWLFPLPRKRYESQTLKSYGVTEYTQKNDTAKAFLDRLQQLGHWSLLREAAVYYENSDMFVVHAGLWPYPMRSSYQRLDSYLALHQGKHYEYEPEEISLHGLAASYAMPANLNKTLVTGHTHYDWGADKRVFTGRRVTPQRVFLASYLDMGDPLFAYESSTQTIKAF